MVSEEEKVLEEQLDHQLQEQRDSLSAVDDALLSDPSNPDLLAVHEELVQAIKDAEEALLHLKRARLLQEADLVLRSTDLFAEEEKVEPLDPADVEPEPLEESCYSVGSKCRFRHKDGRWYNGQVVQLDKSAAKISFLTPTSENMLICKFFLQQRCRFGTNCRLSHGIDVQLLSLKKYVPTIWKPSLAGSSIWAVSNSHAGIWKQAELESWDEEAGVGQVVFRDDGSSAKLGPEQMVLSEYAEGMLDPITVKVLPAKQSLDHALESKKGEEDTEKQRKKRSRGGKRKRDKKIMEAIRAAKEEEESNEDVFTLINNQLAVHSEAINGGSGKKQSKDSSEGKKVDRRTLIAYEDEVKDLKLRVEKLEAIVNINRKEKAVYEAAMRKLAETRKALAKAEATHASASNAVVSKEKEKRWLKF
ncbi:hypothetical protein PIB30_012232 [Stylosanthes scabra]|uniref:C3H1-type domain-containing protein n=1 Tax=Stylosanthes scabra TaxID=79078 RepID=A0ABU6V6W4_9FABA|nr:hypothetical protein [Stylosanthes scabra]